MAPRRRNNAAATPAATERLTPAAFAVRAIDRLRNPKYKGMHSVFSGFNTAWRTYYAGTPDADPVAGVEALVKAGVLETHPSRKGSMIYKAGESPNVAARNPTETLSKMGL